ncbi:MAG TPA: acyl-CoA synthetase [Gemmatimonadales bacterium]|nr:acyl-CoA synthetase [Gemmatimonadales bacterium]
MRKDASPADLPLVSRARGHGDRIAIVDGDAGCTYADLLAGSARVAGTLLAGRRDLNEARVAFVTPADFSYVATQWGIWRAGGIAIPLATSHPPAEWEYALRDSGAELVVTGDGFAEALRPVARAAGIRMLTTAQILQCPAPPALPRVAPDRRAMMVYTSGTTGRPKGVVTTHANLASQVTCLIEAWGWVPDDRILLVLPLHHVHGIVNVLACALWAGGTCEMLPAFDTNAVWDRLGYGRLTLFMAVPTIYRKLIAAWEAAPPERQRTLSAGCARLRLMVSGSAALPVQTLERWRAITGHTLLERYGMTEIGMALSNPLGGERRPGFVGTPLPGVELRLVDESGRTLPAETPGEIEVRGGNVFLEYWGRPGATRDAFRDGWFRTGDVAVLEDGAYRILGRTSIDIIKTGGYKVSALEIEETLRNHPAIGECAVVGVADPEWGERVAAAVELRGKAPLDLETLKSWARERLAPYKIPRALRIVPALPRNAMGKVTKPDVAALFRDG